MSRRTERRRSPRPGLRAPRAAGGRRRDPRAVGVDPESFDLGRLRASGFQRPAPDRPVVEVCDEHDAVRRSHLVEPRMSGSGRRRSRGRSARELPVVGVEAPHGVRDATGRRPRSDKRRHEQALDIAPSPRRVRTLAVVERIEQRSGECVAAAIEHFRSLGPSGSGSAVRTRRSASPGPDDHEPIALESAQDSAHVAGVEVESARRDRTSPSPGRSPTAPGPRPMLGPAAEEVVAQARPPSRSRCG